MKRVLNTIIALMVMSLISGNVFAQTVKLQTVRKGEVVEEARKPKPKKVKPEKEKTEFSRAKGLYLRPEIGGGLYFGNKDGNSFVPGAGGMITLDFGYQITPALSAGIGIGYQFAMGNYSYNYYEYNQDTHLREAKQTYKPLSSIPLYADFRVYLSDTKCQPYFDLKLGYIIGVTSQVVSSRRNYISTGNWYTDGSGANQWGGVWDSWNQYDDYAKMSGFYGALSFGLAIRNFGIGIEADLLRWTYESQKVFHKEFRHNGLPDWEYDQVVAGRNETQPGLSSGEYYRNHGMVSLKLEYNIPITPKKSK